MSLFTDMLRFTSKEYSSTFFCKVCRVNYSKMAVAHHIDVNGEYECASHLEPKEEEPKVVKGLHDLKKAKEELEASILKQIRKFEDTYDVTCSKVDLTLTKDTKETIGVKLHINLGL